jgi:hypothetical protein
MEPIETPYDGHFFGPEQKRVEEVFSKTGFPVLFIPGNSKREKGRGFYTLSIRC